ncbi:MAG: RNA-binding protein [Parachlamydiaceae bacterium]|nr:RNA-binding protein [Parachlamydiaceae bacterium]
MSKLFVGNLSWNTSEDDLQEHFGACGKVKSVKIITDKNTGKSKGFGFVEMETMDEANAAIQKLHDKSLHDRSLRVSLAQERQDRPAGGGFGGGRPERSGGGERREYRSSSSEYGNGGGRSSYQGGGRSR